MIEIGTYEYIMFTRFLFRSVQPDAWNDYSAQNKSDAEIEMAKSQKLREDIFHLIQQTNNDLSVQIDQTTFDFQRRIYEIKQAREELVYQMKKVNKFLTCNKNKKMYYTL